jgi:hypothetical protein
MFARMRQIPSWFLSTQPSICGYPMCFDGRSLHRRSRSSPSRALHHRAMERCRYLRLPQRLCIAIKIPQKTPRGSGKSRLLVCGRRGVADSERDAFMAQFDQSANFEPARSAITLDTFLRFDVPSGIAEWRVELPAGARALIRERRNSSRARASTRAERGFPKAARPFARPW